MSITGVNPGTLLPRPHPLNLLFGVTVISVFGERQTRRVGRGGGGDGKMGPVSTSVHDTSLGSPAKSALSTLKPVGSITGSLGCAGDLLGISFNQEQGRTVIRSHGVSGNRVKKVYFNLCVKSNKACIYV